MAKKQGLVRTITSQNENRSLVAPVNRSRDKAYQAIRCEAKRLSGALGAICSQEIIV